MPIKKLIKKIAARFNYVKVKNIGYNSDGLITSGKNLEFLKQSRFIKAYARGMNSGHMIGGRPGIDLHIEWRVAVACWAAQHGSHLKGDFVECGVNTGILSLAICDYVNFNMLDKSFYLFDTFSGIPESLMSSFEAKDRLHSNSKYPDCYEQAKLNFSNYPRAKLVRGMVPDTLSKVNVDHVCYLSIDMNIAYPEREAIEFFWPKLSPGAMVVLDDYGWLNYENQKNTMDEFALKVGVEILTLPTGQGLIIKP